MRSLQVHFLPALTTPEKLTGATVVVIDVLRASTTICHALAAGARQVIPCLDVLEARKVAKAVPAGMAVFGGERGGLRIDGFDLGNSPTEYTKDVVGGRSVIFTTTNGTLAMDICRLSEKVLIGAFVNAAAVGQVLEHETNVHLLCAGTRGAITREDVLLAGLLARQWPIGATDRVVLNDQARIAVDSWKRFKHGCSTLAVELADTQGGRNLRSIGLESDLESAAQIDRFSCVPRLDISAWSIRLA